MSSSPSSSKVLLEDVSLPEPLGKLSTLVEQNPEAFAKGDEDIRLAALQAVKFVFDLALTTENSSRTQITSLLDSISPSLAPQTRSQAAAVTIASTSPANGKRKRSPSPPPAYSGPTLEETPLSALCIDGMDEDQLWAQLELRAKGVCDILDFALETTGEMSESDDEESEKAKGLDSLVKLNVGGLLEGGEDSEDEDDSEEEDEEDSDSDSDSDEEDVDLGEDVAGLRDPSDEESDEPELDLDKPSEGSHQKRLSRKKGHPILDDGFFNLAEFNAETEASEARVSSRGKLGDDSDDEDEVGDHVDYFAAMDGQQDDEMDGTQEIFYKDFFEPPRKPPSQSPQKPKGKPASNGKVRFHEEVRVKKIKAKGKNLPVATMYSLGDDEDDDEDEDEDYVDMMEDEESEDEEDDLEDVDIDEGSISLSGGSEDFEMGEEGEEEEEESEEESEEGWTQREAIDRLKDDLFADDDEPEESDLTTHEKRMLALQEEIATLESENVEKKHWTLLGEASSRSRPQNALLEEDLEFERVMKSVPVITEEVVQGLEERIKARILESRFDDVIRKRPVDDKPFLPSRTFELQDTKSKQSLAEIYEDEYTAAQTGGAAGDDRDGKLKKEHEELTRIWENICSKSDALSNAHFTPKAPKATISTISNVAAASMESALPTTQATSTMLAPEEVFSALSSDLRARTEFTPTEKRALRNKQKKAKKKARDALDKSVDKFAKARGIGGVKKQKEAALKQVVKTGKGVTVIGKKSSDKAQKGRSSSG